MAKSPFGWWDDDQELSVEPVVNPAHRSLIPAKEWPDSPYPGPHGEPAGTNYGPQFGGRAGQPTGMGRFNRGDKVIVQTAHGPAKAEYSNYDRDHYMHDVTIRGPVGKLPADMPLQQRFQTPHARIANLIGTKHKAFNHEVQPDRS